MRVAERLRALVDDLDYIFDRQQIVRLAVGCKGPCAVNMLGNDIAAFIFLTGIVDRKNVGMLQHTHHVRFRQEHLACHTGFFRIAGLNVINLDGYITTVVGIVR